MNFSYALNMVKENEKVARRGWNGKGMFILLVDGVEFDVRKGGMMDGAFKVGEHLECLPYILMFTAQGKLVPWLASQTDILADDWIVL